MSVSIIEIKARCNRHEQIRNILKEQNARYDGTDYQTDTYFKCNNGRLKLREGTIEFHLIHYNRPNTQEPKHSQVLLYNPNPDSDLKTLLVNSLGILVEVKKKREIYFVDNVKVHLDEVNPLGSFLEIEAIDEDGTIGLEKLHIQCNDFMKMYGVEKEDLIDCSYSDLLLEGRY